VILVLSFGVIYYSNIFNSRESIGGFVDNVKVGEPAQGSQNLNISKNIPLDTEYTVPEELKERESKAVTADTYFVKDYIKNINAQLASTTGTAGIMNKKLAYAYSYPYTTLITNRAERDEKTIISYNEMYKLGGEIKSLNSADKVWFTNKFYYIFYQTFENSCFIHQNLYKSDWVKDPEFVKISNKYPDQKVLASFVFFNSLFEKIPNREMDNITASTQAFIISRILRDFGDKISDVDKTQYIAKLSYIMNNYNLYTKSKNFAVPNNAVFVPKSYYAFNVDVLSDYDKTITKETVAKTYEKTLLELDAAKLSDSDPSLLYKMWVSNMYLGFLQKNNLADKTKVQSVVNEILKIDKAVALGESTKAIQFFFFSNSQTSMGSWDSIRQNIILVAKDNSDFKIFLIKYGVKFN